MPRLQNRASRAAPCHSDRAGSRRQRLAANRRKTWATTCSNSAASPPRSAGTRAGAVQNGANRPEKWVGRMRGCPPSLAVVAGDVVSRDASLLSVWAKVASSCGSRPNDASVAGSKSAGSMAMIPVGPVVSSAPMKLLASRDSCLIGGRLASDCSRTFPRPPPPVPTVPVKRFRHSSPGVFIRTARSPGELPTRRSGGSG